MDVLDKLRREIKEQDRLVREELLADSRFSEERFGYDFDAADMRDLLEAAFAEIARLRTHIDLQRSVMACVPKAPAVDVYISHGSA